MSRKPDEILSEYSSGQRESSQIQQFDHSTWWAAFMSLVGSMPGKAEDLHLSDDPVHLIHGHLFSIRECAGRAIDDAYSEDLAQTAYEYEEKARLLIYSYDKRVFKRVSRSLDRLRLKYLGICAASMLLAALLSLLYIIGQNKSTGLPVLITLSVLFAAGNAVIAALTNRRKRKILYRRTSHNTESNANEFGTGTDL